jgi:hypothetical protein
MQVELASVMVDKRALFHDLLRLAPVHLREQRMPLTSLEDVIALFDAADEDSQLPEAVLMYHLVEYLDKSGSKAMPVSASFISCDV